MADTDEATHRPGERGLAREAFAAAWLAARLGVDPLEIEARRRAGELLGVPSDRGEYLYPVWQFGPDGEPLPAIARLVRAAREAGLRDRELYELLLRRDGITGPGRLLDSVRDGREERVLDAIRAARAS